MDFITQSTLISKYKHQLLDYFNDHRFYDYKILVDSADSWFALEVKRQEYRDGEKINYAVRYVVQVDEKGCHLKYRTFAPFEWIKVTSINMINHFNGEFAHVKRDYDQSLYVEAMKQQGWR